jgi:signal transduction histidine kinase/ligand-binding sensor domain-containing protein
MLWFGTNGAGIGQYDGHQFTTLSIAEGLPDNVILSLLMDHKNNLWIGTSTGGLCKYDGHKVSQVQLNDAVGLSRGVTCIVEDAVGNIWAGTRGRGIYRISSQEIRHFTLKQNGNNCYVHAMIVSADGTLWVSSNDGLYRFNGDDFIYCINSPSGKVSNAMLCSNSNTLWIGYENGAISKCTFHGDDLHFEEFNLNLGHEALITCMCSYDQQHIWVGTRNHGAFCFNANDAIITPVKFLNQNNGLAGNEIMCMLNDAHGHTWIGTRRAGLSHYRGDAFSNYTGFMPISISENSQGEIWIGTNNGLAKYSDKRLTTWEGNKKWSNYFYSLSHDRLGHVVVANNLQNPEYAGISIIQENEMKVLQAKFYSREIFWTLCDNDSTIWLAGRRGVEKWTNNVCITYSVKQGLGNKNALCLLKRKDGTIWAGTDGGGFSRIGEREMSTWTEAQGLPNNVIWCLEEDHTGALWAATLNGLCRFDGKTFLTYNNLHGLPDNNLQQVMQTRSGQLMIGSLKGIVTLTGWKNQDGVFIPFSEMSDLTNDALIHFNPVFEVYNSSTGYPVKDLQSGQHSLFEASDNTYWIATGNDKTSLVHFSPDALKKDSTQMHLQLLKVQINNQPICWYLESNIVSDSATRAQQEMRTFGKILSPSERLLKQDELANISLTGISPHFPIPENLVLNYLNNRIGFEFCGVETSQPEGVVYSYKLDGYDAQWSKPDKSNRANFGNLSEGRYTFILKAKNAFGNWCQPLSYHFTVLPPWYRSWWAYILYAMLAMSLLITYNGIRTRSLTLQKVKLEKMVSERTEELKRKKEEADQQRERAEFSEKAKQQFLANMSHEIRTPMNAIMGMSDILRNRTHLPEQDKFLNAIAQSSENLMVIVNDILDLSKIDAGKIQLENMPFSIRKVLENLLDVLQFKAEEKGLHLILKLAPEIPDSLIGDPTRINQIIMNLAGNAIKFTEKGQVEIIANWENNDNNGILTIQVSDSGIGIPPDRLNKIFEEFTQAYSDTTRKYGGTGLGLTISLRLAKMIGGDIQVQSIQGLGSTFTVILPMNVG